MTNLTPNHYIDYLKNTIQLESSLLIQNQVRSNLIAAYMRSKPRMPDDVVPPEQPEAPKLYSIHSFTNAEGEVVRPAGEVVGKNVTKPVSNGEAKALLIMGIVTLFLTILIDILTDYFLFKIILSILLYVFGGMPLILSIQAYHAVGKNAKLMEGYEAEFKEWENLCQSIEMQNKAQLEQYYKELKEWEDAEPVFLHSKEFVEEEMKKTGSILQLFYGANVIHPKYRTLPAETSICEYFETGRCNSLTGPAGAYNMYEEEVRRDTIISRLNTVIEHLNQIRQNQYMLYHQLVEVQKTGKTIADSLNRIEGYVYDIRQLSAVQSYYSMVTAENTRAIAWLEVFNNT